MSFALALAVAVSALPATGGGAVVYRAQAVVAGDAVVLADVADLSVLPPDLRARAGALVMARFRPGQREMAIQPGRLTEKAQALMPVLAARLSATGAPILVKRQAVVPPASARICLAAERDLSMGETPSLDDFRPAPCGPAVPGTAFRYDAALGAVRLTWGLKTGDQVLSPPASTLTGVRAGQTLTLVVRVGPVQVERQVLAARSSGRGKPVFVYGDDGKIFSAPAPGVAQ